MNSTIDHITLLHLADAGAVRVAQVIGQDDGWSILIKYGLHERLLAARQSQQIRSFKKFETVVNYLRKIGIVNYQVDATNYDPTIKTYTRPDRSEALKNAHAAAAYEKWQTARVKATLDDEREPLSQEDAFAEVDKRMAEKYGSRP